MLTREEFQAQRYTRANSYYLYRNRDIWHEKEARLRKVETAKTNRKVSQAYEKFFQRQEIKHQMGIVEALRAAPLPHIKGVSYQWSDEVVRRDIRTIIHLRCSYY